MTPHKPAVVLAQLQERVSKSGRPYLTGNCGLVRIVVVKSDEIEDDGAQIWKVILQETEQGADVAADGSRFLQRLYGVS